MLGRKIALVSSEPSSKLLAGIGIRYHEFACQISANGFEVCLYTPSSHVNDDVIPSNYQKADLDPAAPSELLLQRLSKYDVIIAQGYLASIVSKLPLKTPMVFDLYDPYIIENLSYQSEFGDRIFNRDLLEWEAQLNRGDYFLCATNEQKLFLQGWIMSLGRFSPESILDDPNLSELYALIPSGVSNDIPKYRPVLPKKDSQSTRILFGGIYNWYDPWTLLEAASHLPNIQIVFVRSRNPEQTPQNLYQRVVEYCKKNELGSDQVLFIDWVPFDRRFDLLSDVDLLVAPHKQSIESELSFRTRYIEAMSIGCPVIATEGGGIASVINTLGGGLVIPPEDTSALCEAIVKISSSKEKQLPSLDVSKLIHDQYSWSKLTTPLLAFCENPVRRFTKRITKCTGLENLNNSIFFSVIVPTYNRMDVFPEVIEALDNQKQAPNYELVIVNDGSTDGTSKWLSQYQFKTQVTVIETNNRGPASARDKGINQANGDYIVLMGDDMVADPFWLNCHYHEHQQRKFETNIAILGKIDWHKNTKRTSFLNFIDRSGWQFAYDKINDKENVQFNFFYGSNLSLPSALLKKHQFDKSFRYPAWEDVELGYRLCQAGLRIIYSPGARVAHQHPVTIKRFCQRHWKAGFSAVQLCYLHPELKALAWPEKHQLESAQIGIARSFRKGVARLFENLKIDLPNIWEKMLRDYYIEGLNKALEDFETETGESAIITSFFPMKFFANSPTLLHQTGEASSESWICSARKHPPGHCIYGPYHRIESNARLKVTFDLFWRSVKPGINLANVDIYDSSSDSVLNSHIITTSMEPHPIHIEINSEIGQTLEFRVYWFGTCDLKIDSISIDHHPLS